jgi:hypothetical protein
MTRQSAAQSESKTANLSAQGRRRHILRVRHGLLQLLPPLARVFMALWRYRRGGNLAGLKKLDRDLDRMRVAENLKTICSLRASRLHELLRISSEHRSSACR